MVAAPVAPVSAAIPVAYVKIADGKRQTVGHSRCRGRDYRCQSDLPAISSVFIFQYSVRNADLKTQPSVCCASIDLSPTMRDRTAALLSPSHKAAGTTQL